MKKIKLKSNKKKKFNTKPFKFLFLIIVCALSFTFTLKYLISNNSEFTKDEYVNYLLNKFSGKKTNNFIIKESVKLLSSVDLKQPSSLIDQKIKTDDVKVVNNIKKDATSNEDNYDEDVYKKITSYVENKNNDKDNPIVYLYNSHQLETYSNSGLENNNITPNVMMMSYLLSEELNKNNVPTIVEDTNISEFIKISSMPSDSFYASTRIFIKNAMNKYPTIKYFIDLHRDSVNKSISTATINNKSYARTLFVLGTTNKNYKENEKLMKALDSIMDKYYPGLSRGIYNRPTPNWPDAYNQDLNEGVILIEVGAKENTLEEVSNTVNALSNVIKIFIKGE